MFSKVKIQRAEFDRSLHEWGWGDAPNIAELWDRASENGARVLLGEMEKNDPLIEIRPSRKDWILEISYLDLGIDIQIPLPFLLDQLGKGTIDYSVKQKGVFVKFAQDLLAKVEAIEPYDEEEEEREANV